VPKQWALHQARSALYGGGGGVAKVGVAHALIAPGFFAVDPGSNPPLFCHTLSEHTISSAYYTIQPQLHDPTLLIHDPTVALPILQASTWAGPPTMDDAGCPPLLRPSSEETA